MRNMLILTAMLVSTACADRPRIEVRPAEDAGIENGQVSSQWNLSVVTIVSEQRDEDGNISSRRYRGTKIGDDLVLTSTMTAYDRTPSRVVYTDTAGNQKEADVKVYFQEDRYWLLVLKTSTPLDIPSATFRKELPKLGDAVYVVRAQGLQEFLVNSIELRYNGARFSVWPKEDDSFSETLDDGMSVFDREGRLVGITSNEVYSSHTNLPGYGRASIVIYPAPFVRNNLQAAPTTD